MRHTLRNWAGNVDFAARRLCAPSRVEELQELVARSGSLRALGTGHSFSTVADTAGTLVSVASLPRLLRVDAAGAAVEVGGGLRFGEFTGDVHEQGFALHNLGSLPHISVAGACATGTHGSGVHNRTLGAAVREMEFVAADGELVTLSRGEADFAGAVVALGTLGVVTRLVLDAVPAYDVQQWVYEDLPVRAWRENLDDVLAAAYSVSAFTAWRADVVDQVWLKHRVAEEGPRQAPARWLGATLAGGPRHPVPGQPADSCTAQGGLPGPWQARLPHFRLDHTPSSGDELQSEYFVGRVDALAAFDALALLGPRIAPVLQISEIRTVAADDLWLSPAQGRDSVAFHFTWRPDTEAVLPVLREIEAALEPFEPRPHWGKLFRMDPGTVASRYAHHGDFRRLAERFDPAGTFRNTFTDAYVRDL